MQRVGHGPGAVGCEALKRMRRTLRRRGGDWGGGERLRDATGSFCRGQGNSFCGLNHKYCAAVQLSDVVLQANIACGHCPTLRRRQAAAEDGLICASKILQHSPSASCFPSVNDTGIVFKRTSVTSAVNNTKIVFKRTTNIDP